MAGTSGIPIVVCGTGDTMRAARVEEYDRVRRVRLPNAYYRDDIGRRWLEGNGDRLTAWGDLR